jgi:hypothetical protein
LRWCLKKHQERSSFTHEHVAAADKLRGLYDGGTTGFSPRRDYSQPVQSIMYRPSQGPTVTAKQQFKCGREFDAVWGTFDEPEKVLVRMVLLENLSLGKAAKVLNWSPPMTTVALVAVLDRLCERWDIRPGTARQAA